MKSLSALAAVAVVVACAPACRFGACEIGASSCDGNDVLTCVYGEPSCSDCDPPHVQSRATCPASKPTCEEGAGGAACLVAGTRTDCNARSAAEGAPIRVADFDGDRRPDLLLAALGNHAIAFSGPDGTLRVAAVTDGAPADAKYTLAADFDGDGLADLARLGGQTQGIALGNGDGTFRWTPIDADTLVPVQAADVDGDHAMDVVALDSSSRVVVVLGGPAPRVLAPQPLACAPSCTAHAAGIARPDDAFAAAATADFDGDGLGDVVVASDGAYVVLLGAKSGVLREGAAQTSGDRPAAVADLDADGRSDLVFVHEDHVRAARGVGDGTFRAAVDSTATPYPNLDAAVLDFDGDGRLDVVTTTPPYAYVLVVQRGRGDGTFDAPMFVEPTRGVVSVASVGGSTLALGVLADPTDAASAVRVVLADAPCR